jgi:hypothetical protein
VPGDCLHRSDPLVRVLLAYPRATRRNALPISG